MRDHRDTRRVCRLLPYIPLHRHPPLWIVLELFNAQTICRMHGHPASTRDIADNTITWQGMATPGEVDEDVVQPLYFNTLMTRFVRDRRDRLALLLALLNNFWRQQAVDHLESRHPAIPHCDHEVIRRLETKMRGHGCQRLRLEIGVGIRHIFLSLTLTDLTPQRQAAGFVFRFQPGFNFGPRPRCDHPAQPVTARHMCGRRENFHGIAVAQLVPQRHDTPIDLGANALMPDVRMHHVGKINRGGTTGERPYFAAWGEDVDLLLEHIDFHGLHELDGVLHVLLP